MVDGNPCIEALVAANPNLKRSEELANWRLIVDLYRDAGHAELPLGAFDTSRVRKDFGLLRDVQGTEVPGDPATAFDNAFLDAAFRAGARTR